MIVGSIGYACASGLGHLNKWFYANKVVDKVFVIGHPEYSSHMEWFPGAPSTPLRRPDTDAVLRWALELDVLLCYETPFFWGMLPRLRQAGVKLAMVPMHEWYPADKIGEFDLYLCPSLLDLDEFANEAAPSLDQPQFVHVGKDVRSKAVFIPVPVDPSTWRRRTRVRRFLHNAGHVGHREHKGTRQLLEAMRLVTKPIDLTVRGQGRELTRLLNEFARGDGPGCAFNVMIGDGPYEEMFSEEFDAYVAPEKLNGLSLPLQEARAAGMLVITTDRYPTNTWLPKMVENMGDERDWSVRRCASALIPVERYQRAKVCTSCIEVDEAIVSPEAIARTLDAWYGADIGDYSDSGLEWAKANSWGVWAPKYRKLLEELL